jgi:hypothetical protein
MKEDKILLVFIACAFVVAMSAILAIYSYNIQELKIRYGNSIAIERIK